MQPEVYTARDIATAARVPEPLVESLMARGDIGHVAQSVRFVGHDEAVRAVRALHNGAAGAVPDRHGSLGRELFAPLPDAARWNAARWNIVPLAVSTALHGLAAVSVLLMASVGYATADARTEPPSPNSPIRMVFLTTAGVGGGGGGGGLRQRAPVARAERRGMDPRSSPLPARPLPPPVPAPQRPEPLAPPLEAKALPPVLAPIATSPADRQDTAGVLAAAAPQLPSAGSGAGGGAGSGAGTGLGEGHGAGVGAGSGGGTGGGPYRPGSGVEPPRLLREVRARYSDAARRANLEGEVEMEIVVRRDGLVGEVRVLRGLGADLDARAIEAVRQWRFAPARLQGTAVDVVVEVAVEFKLR